MAVRRGLGATPWSVVRQFVAESLLLAAIGGACGCALVRIVLPLLPRFVPVELPAAGIALDLPVLLFAVTVTLATGLAAGLAPALPARARRSSQD